MALAFLLVELAKFIFLLVELAKLIFLPEKSINNDARLFVFFQQDGKYLVHQAEYEFKH